MTNLSSLTAYHQYQGRTNDCAPFVVAMVVNARRGTQLSGAQVARAMNWPRRWLGPLPLPVIRRLPNAATFPWGIADELKRNGITARWRFGARESDLLNALQAGRLALPIIGGFRPLWAHIKILVAHHPEHGWGFIDPAHPRPEVTWNTPGQFARWWRNWGRLLVEEC